MTLQLSEPLNKKLEKLGYKVENLSDLFEILPKAIFISQNAKKIIRKPITYHLIFGNNIYTLNLAFKDDDGELSVIERFTNISLAELLAKTILFLENSGLVKTDI